MSSTSIVRYSRHEPFCTVFLAQVNEPVVGVKIEEQECS